MDILMVIGILVIWAVRGLSDALIPPNPPLSYEELEEQGCELMQLSTPKERQKYLKRKAIEAYNKANNKDDKF